MADSFQVVSLESEGRLERRTYLFRLPMGKNCHELLTAPNPDSKPRIIVPRTISRVNAAVVVSDDPRDSGSGM